MSCTSGICTPTSANAVLNVGDLQTMLASSNVKLAAAGEPVDVDINAGLTWVSTNAFTIDSHHSINVNQPVAITGGGGLAVTTNDGGSGGTFQFAPGANVAIWSLASNLTINGNAYTLVGDIATLAADVSGNPNGFYALANNYNAAADGTYSSSPISTFSGSFQALGNVITNLTISNHAKSNGTVGLFSVNSGTIANVRLQNATMAQSGSGAAIGGIVAENQGLLFGDHVAGNISCGHHCSAGGLAGVNQGAVTESSASTSVNGSSYGYIGGLVGANNGAISESFATGPSKAGKLIYAGGLVGNSVGGAISNVYVMGSAKGGDSANVGGVIGTFDGGTIGEAYSTGRVTGGFSGSEVGGFVGQLRSGTISDSYWDTQTSKTKYAGGGSKKLPGITGLTTSQLQSSLPAGFDPTVWAENPSINNGLPYLIANPPQ
jgi:hypothetical protein